MKQLTQNTFTKGATQYSNIASPMDSQATQLIQARKNATTGNLEYMTANSQQYTELLSKAQHIKSVDTIYTDSSNLPSVDVSDGDILPALTSNALPLKLYVYSSSSAEWSVYSVVQASALYYADDKDALLIATSSSPYFLSVSDLSSCEKIANKVTSLSAQSTTTEYPSAKTVYDAIQNNKQLFKCIYGTSAYIDITTALNDNKIPYIVYNDKEYLYQSTKLDGTYCFMCIVDTQLYACYITNNNSWSSLSYSIENTNNKVTSLSSSSTDTEYPSAKCVYDIIGDVDTLLTNLNSGGGVQPTPQPLPVEYFEFVNGEITGFSSTGQTAYNNGEITDLVLPSEDGNGNPVTSIGSSAFISCSSLTSISIPDSVTSLNWYTFEYCTGLTSITIPSSVISIGKSSFYGCTNLTSITVEPIVPPMLGSSVFDDTNDAPIYVPAQSVTDYQEATDWVDYVTRIQSIQE